jgi:hypothetical protein
VASISEFIISRPAYEIAQAGFIPEIPRRKLKMARLDDGLIHRSSEISRCMNLEALLYGFMINSVYLRNLLI